MVRISTMFYVENVSKCVTEGSLKAKKGEKTYFGIYILFASMQMENNVCHGMCHKMGIRKAPKTQCFRGFSGVPGRIRTSGLQSRSGTERI